MADGALIAVIWIIVGGLLLVAGRKLFWLFVGVVGFAIAFVLASGYLQIEPEWLSLIIALAAGVAGALLAVVLKQLAIALAGFLAGGYGVLTLTQILNLDASSFTWVLVIVGGIVAAVVAVVVFDWMLIVVSSIFGASMILQSMDTVIGPTEFSTAASIVTFVALIVVGCAVQFVWMSLD
jgi:hypothetical protein